MFPDQSGGRINEKGALSGDSKPNFEAKLANLVSRQGLEP